MSTFPPVPFRPSTPPNAGFGFNSGGGGICDKCCSCFGRSGSYGAGMNPQMNMGMGMNSGGCCSRMFGGMCGGSSGGCCPGGGMGMGRSTGCFGTSCCPFGGQRNMGMDMGGMGMMPTPIMGGGMSTPGITSTAGFGAPLTPGIGMTPGFGGSMGSGGMGYNTGGMGYNAGVYGPGLGTTGCCFCP